MVCEEVGGRERWTEETLLMDDQHHNYDTHHNYQHTYIHIRHPYFPLKSDIHIHDVHENTNINNKHPTIWMRKVDFKHLIFKRGSRSPIPVSPSSGTSHIARDLPSVFSQFPFCKCRFKRASEEVDGTAFA